MEQELIIDRRYYTYTLVDYTTCTIFQEFVYDHRRRMNFWTLICLAKMFVN